MWYEITVYVTLKTLYMTSNNGLYDIKLRFIWHQMAFLWHQITVQMTTNNVSYDI